MEINKTKKVESKRNFFKYGLVGLLAVAGCSLPKPNFDIKNYVNNFWKTGNNLVNFGGGRTYNRSLLAHRGPAIYGFGGIGSGQTDNVLDNVCSAIETSECHYHKLGKYPKIMERVKEQHKAGNPIIFIAHSAGCGEAVNVASILEKTNVPIGMIFLDAAYLNSGLYKPSSKIPRNVYRVENYISKGPYKGRELMDSDFENNNSARTKYQDFRVNASHGGLTKKFEKEYIKSIGRILGEYRSRYGY